MKKLLFIFSVLLFVGCNNKTERSVPFSSEALADTFIGIDEQPITLQQVLDKYKGKKVMLEVCASWCKDCILGLHYVNKLKEKHPDAAFVFLSLDKTIPRWKRGIERFDFNGDHYFLQSEWEGAFGEFINLDQIPRYMVVNEEGQIVLMRATNPQDPALDEALN
ncbi:TlpA family protein disulfide reductase [Tenacibaculum sp. IB213877]|uniref:TlpA family protein disulfide reductase n=1 Tax=Tenacibaculum sp. IB213877 TaxID=3097351 RepID=UPI002A5AEC8B|nr:redoxin family protein [Tenacibaculum sp. IB213877]MDY0780150.1 redoxin family protein [Tenacibaculum sp. IB213877]